MKVHSGGSWKDFILNIRLAGIWRESISYIRQNGYWWTPKIGNLVSMTSDTTPTPFTATGTNPFGTEPPYVVFDNDDFTRNWLHNTNEVGVNMVQLNFNSYKGGKIKPVQIFVKAGSNISNTAYVYGVQPDNTEVLLGTLTLPTEWGTYAVHSTTIDVSLVNQSEYKAIKFTMLGGNCALYVLRVLQWYESV